jgi:hypothetical protein
MVIHAMSVRNSPGGPICQRECGAVQRSGSIMHDLTG